MDLKFKISGRIAKPVAVVFEAVANPDHLSHFFTTGGAKGRLETGATVSWDFADFPGAFPVRVEKVVPNKKIVLHWAAADDAAEGETFVPHDTTITMTFEPLDGDTRTLITITEEGWQDTPKGLAAAFGNSEGWTGMFWAMKMWLEHGLHVREGTYK
jgi:uncharacterized protein YndB with AHSA1/START domain